MIRSLPLAVLKRQATRRPQNRSDPRRLTLKASLQIRLELKSLALSNKRLPKVAQLFDPFAHIIETKVFDPGSLLDLFPGHGNRDRGFRCWPDRINRSQRS